jgi:hypothetical protein
LYSRCAAPAGRLATAPVSQAQVWTHRHPLSPLSQGKCGCCLCRVMLAQPHAVALLAPLPVLQLRNTS